MNPNDETIYQSSMVQDDSENNEVKQEEVTPKSEKKSNEWAKVTISGVTGILMGAGGMYAGKPYVDEMTDEWRESLAYTLEENGIEVPGWLWPKHHGDEIAQADPADGPKTDVTPESEPVATMGAEPAISTNPNPESESVTVRPEPQAVHPAYIPTELHVATVDQNLSFGHAFAEARAEVGPGGVFYWHGGVYNTYTEAEWNSMSAADRSDFAHQVAPAVYHHADYYENMAQQENHGAGTSETETPDVVIVEDTNQGTATESEVHILGVNQFVNEDGDISNAGFATIDGEPIVMVDVDGDGVFDGAIHDNNGNGQIDENEVLDISSAEITTDSWAAEAIAQGNSEDGSFNADHSPQDELASDQPDYENDADVSDLYNA